MCFFCSQTKVSTQQITCFFLLLCSLKTNDQSQYSRTRDFTFAYHVMPLSDITRGTTKDAILRFSPVNTLKCVKSVELPFKQSSIRPYIQNHNVYRGCVWLSRDMTCCCNSNNSESYYLCRYSIPLICILLFMSLNNICIYSNRFISHSFISRFQEVLP